MSVCPVTWTTLALHRPLIPFDPRSENLLFVLGPAQYSTRGPISTAKKGSVV